MDFVENNVDELSITKMEHDGLLQHGLSSTQADPSEIENSAHSENEDEDRSNNSQSTNQQVRFKSGYLLFFNITYIIWGGPSIFFVLLTSNLRPSPILQPNSPQ